jgi:predicted nucleic acid-binding protein
VEKHAVKILDATIISSFLHDIQSIDMFERCNRSYELITTNEVSDEIKRTPSSKSVPRRMSRLVTPIELNENEKKLLDYLSARYPGLHAGELSTLILTASRYASGPQKYYYITDDNLMRKSLKRIESDPVFQDFVGKVTVLCTGTIGILLHLCDNGTISSSERAQITDDLEHSTFYCPEELLKRLRG